MERPKREVGGVKAGTEKQVDSSSRAKRVSTRAPKNEASLSFSSHLLWHSTLFFSLNKGIHFKGSKEMAQLKQGANH